MACNYKPIAIFLLTCMLVSICYLHSASGAEGAFPNPERIRASYTSITPSGAPLWIPYELGFFKEEGLNVELIYVNSATRALSALFAGQTQFTTGGVSTAVQAYISGGDPVVIAGTVNKMNVSIFSVPEVQLPAELKGKKLGITRLGGLYDFAANYALKKWGLSAGRDVVLIQIGESPQTWYMFKTMDAIVPRYEIGGLRLTSDIVIEREVDGKLRREKPGLAPGGRWTELLFLFSIKTGELLAIVHGGYLQRLRVGATSGLCAKHVAQPGAKKVALIGTGGLAGPHLEALSRIYTLDEVRVYSPSEEHRKAFVEHWISRLDLRIKAVKSPREAIDDTQIVSLVTNSLSPVLEGDWLRPGMHVNSVQRGEFDTRTIERSDFIVIRSRDRDTHWYMGPRAPEEVKFDRSEDPALTPKMRALGGIIAGLEKGRTRADQITLFSGSGLGSAGLGIQLLSVAGRAYEKAKQRGLGRELPTEWFSQPIHT